MGILINLILNVLLQVPAVRICLVTVMPSILLLLYVRHKDRTEPESPSLVWSLFGLGALSVLLALLLELGGILGLTRIMDESSILYTVLHWYLVVGLMEELSKYLVVRLRTWNNKEFDCLFDGMVYTVAAAAGFSLLENIFYLFGYGAGVVWLRALVSIPAHICFGVLMGAWYSAAKKHAIRGDRRMSRLCNLLAVVVPALVHGLFDHLASQISSVAGMIPFLLIVAAMFIACWFMIRKLSEKDAYYSA